MEIPGKEALVVRVGTKSLLFGCHQFLVHPIVVLICWWKLYGRGRVIVLPSVFADASAWPGFFSWRVWLAALIHDWGYWGCTSMDGKEPTGGDRHPERVANWSWVKRDRVLRNLILYHSRFYAKGAGMAPSPLCWADKLAICILPSWLWALFARLSREGFEYLDDGKYEANWITKGDSTRQMHWDHTYFNLITFHKRVRDWCSGWRKDVETRS